MMHTHLPTLDDIFANSETVTIACSGGVDSMTLAYAAHAAMGTRAVIGHAVSPAVPQAATDRVRRYAQREGWHLRVLDVGEFADPQYMANPANRCFFCKSKLYGTLSKLFAPAQVCSGTNLDDLGDWRPGLKAAALNGVRHPFVEAGFAKRDVRALAASFGLADLAELPSSPCLSSRVETGIRIDADALRAIDGVETMLRAALRPRTLRCRLRKAGVVIELDAATLGALPAEVRHDLSNRIRAAFASLGSVDVSFAPYSRGSAFLKETLA